MGPPSFLSLLCLGLVISSAASQSIYPENTSDDTNTSETMMTFTIYIQNLDHSDAHNVDIEGTVKAMMSEVGGEIVAIRIENGDPCTEVYVQWRNADIERVNAMFRYLAVTGIVLDDQQYTIGFEGCQAAMHRMDIPFYIHGMAWNQRMADKDSDEYRGLKMLFSEYFSPLEGEIKAMHLQSNYDCVAVLIQYMASQPLNLLGVMSGLKQDGINLYGNQVYQISDKPCMPNTDDLNECPEPSDRYVGPCNNTCDADTPCGDGFKCCYSGCGKSCVRVGYAMSIRCTAVLDMPWLISLWNQTSQNYTDLGDALTAAIKEHFVDMLHAVDIHRYGPFRDEDMHNATKASLTLYFNMDYTNDQIFDAHLNLLKSSVPRVAMFTMGNERRCGSTECHGICKHMMRGAPYCSCNLGRLGPGCTSFDCRKDVTASIPNLSQNYCRGRGECAHNEEYGEQEKEWGEGPMIVGPGEGPMITAPGESMRENTMPMMPEPMYQCECQPPYFGESCKHQLCDVLTSPCNDHGYCTGMIHQGEICVCQDGWGGLFCENDVPDPVMTLCDKKERLMSFVHDQVTGQSDQLESMVLPMKMILKMMGSYHYDIPYCLSGQFYTACYYNASSGEKDSCQCIGSDEEPNFYFYFDKNDCRVFSGSPMEYSQTVYLLDTKWTNAMSDRSSDVYTAIYSQVEAFMVALGGAVRHLELKPRGSNCVEMAMDVIVDRSKAYQLKEALPINVFSINDIPTKLSLEPCKKEIDIHSCPHVAADEFSICIYECNPEAQLPECGGGETCCPLACGGGHCVELGYLQKVTVSITLSIPYKPSFSDSSSTDYLILLSTLATHLSAFVNGRDIPGYESLDVAMVTNSSYSRFTANESDIILADRKKRQAVLSSPEYTTVVLVLTFSQEVDVKVMMNLKADMEMQTLEMNGEVHSVTQVTFGDQGSSCGGRYCHESSICVDQFGDDKKCVCPKGRSGPSCHQTNCFDEDGNSMCDNGGKCDWDSWNRGVSTCSCQPGYSGELCEVAACDYFKPGVCNTGKCSFDGQELKICSCPPNRGGLFCELDAPDNLTQCEIHSRLMNFVVDSLTGKRDELIIPMADFLKITDMTEYMILVPTCWKHVDGHYGEYKYVCYHDIYTGEIHRECMCVTGSGHPNYRAFDNGKCDRPGPNVTSACDMNPCYSNGTCVQLGSADYYCQCPWGLEGRNCERKRRQYCPDFSSPLHNDDSSMRSCLGQACPFGFECNTLEDDGYCCIDYSFMCTLEICQNGAECMGDIDSGHICDCPRGKGGLFCEKDYEQDLTNCEIKQRFYTWVMALLTNDQQMPAGSSLTELRRLLAHMEMKYFMDDICDDQGSYKTRVTAYNIYDLTETKDVCLDDSGFVDAGCSVEVCQTLDVISFCKNGGECVGDVSEKLCECEGTGYHGIMCELPGKETEQTHCTQGKMIAEFAIGLLNGSTELVPGIKDMLSNVLALFYSESIFVPDCDEYSKHFTNRGCAHMLNNTNEIWCYCSNLWGEPTTNEFEKNKLPARCPVDGEGSHSGGDSGEDEDKCPRQWGPDCHKPDWWCSEDDQCDIGMKCYSPVPCDEEGCYADRMKHQCVPDEIELPCEPRPCAHNPRDKCMPCGEHGTCLHVKKGKGDGKDDGMPGGKDEYEKDDNDDDKSYDKDDEDYDKDPREMFRGMKMEGEGNYMCKCQKGWSGKNCQIREDVCRHVPSDLCSHGCIGDIEAGKLCRCPEGLSGLLCNKPARTKCQVEQAFFEDAIAIVKGEMKDGKYNTQDYRRLIRDLTTQYTNGSVIPVRKCSSDGMFERLQCNFNIYYMKEVDCYCADRHGEYVSSNVEPYINYPVCTGPGDFRGLGYHICSVPGLCLNGGDCVVDLYRGKMCDCKDGFHGLFCQHRSTEPEEEPLSFCNYLEDSFLTAQRIVRNESVAWLGQVSNIQLYLNLTWMMIGTENRDIKGHTMHLVGMKVECNPDGTFKPYICDRDLNTNEIIACYCSGFKGPIIGTEAPDVESLECGWDKMTCHELEDRCPRLRCEHGHRMDLDQCPTCECKQPCEGVVCKPDERCVVSRDKNCMDHDMMRCREKAVCMPKSKPGICPGHEASTFASIIGGGLSRKPMESGDDLRGNQYPDMTGVPGMNAGKGNEADRGNGMGYPDDMEGMQCRIECVDDADCDGKKKCCGLCGNVCKEPIKPDNCLDARDMATDKLQLILETQKNIHQNMSRSLYMTVFHLSKMEEIWIPSCKDYAFKPVQCKFSISEIRDNNKRVATGCFCVDMLGNHIKGSQASGPDDEMACQVKPLSCPAPNPMHEGPNENYQDKCQQDMDCVGGDKCCSDGVRKLCLKPADPKETSSTLDRMMTNLCQLAPDACGGSQCTGKWESEGESCDCPYNRKGPFCEVNKYPSDKAMTVCQRKRFALERFNQSIDEYRRAASIGKELEDHQLKGALEVLEKLIQSWDEEVRAIKYAKMSMIYYKCDEEGEFYSMQCSLNMHTGMKESCFCVDRLGKELLGTRMPVSVGMPHCGGKEPSCKIGHPLRDNRGDITTCGTGRQCPGFGYACVRGMFGDLHCCPNGYEEDVCLLTRDVGFTCKEEDPVAQRTYYAYNWSNKKCEAFEYHGCGGNRNRFLTMQDCENRCINDMHLGECPYNFKISKNSNCQDSCATDSECPNDMFKCCQSSCGKHCVPSVQTTPKEGMCPYGHNTSQMCMSNDECQEGFYCYMSQDAIDNVGTCCVDVNAANLCHIKPWATLWDSKESMSESDSVEDKYGKGDGQKDDNDSMMKGDKFDDNDSMMKGGMTDEDDKKDWIRDSMDDDDDWYHVPESDDNDSAVKKSKRKGMMACKEEKSRFFYNPDRQTCQQMTVCKDVDFNSFESMEECCDLCGSGTRCKPGVCPEIVTGIVLSCKNECLADSDCRGNRICCHNGCAMSCRLPLSDGTARDEALTKCQKAQMEAMRGSIAMNTDQCAINFVPSCDERTKMYSRHQCQMSLGLCWCVTDQGHYIPDTMTRGPAHCDDVTDIDMVNANENPQDLSSVDFEVCPADKPVHCCKAAMCMKKCRAHPEAVCRINPCGGCEAQFYNAMGNQVDCDEGLSKCEQELKMTSDKILEGKITAYNNRRLEESDAEKDLIETDQYIDDIEQGRVIRKDVPMKCQQLPSSGNCKGFLKRWFYHPETRQCSMFIWGMCGGNENRFRTPEECYSVCDPTANPCASIRCGNPNPKCTLLYSPDCYQNDQLCSVQGHCTMDPEVNMIPGVFVPQCLSSGSFNWKQCHGHYCWCVNSQGQYNGGMTNAPAYGDLECLESGPSENSVAIVDKCPDGTDPRIECVKECNNKVCPGHPTAVCQVDLCSNTCATRFILEGTSKQVTCEEDKCKVFRFDETETKNDGCQSDVLCGGQGVKTCPRDVCENANEEMCPKNPCAVCMVDPCTCNPYFVDITTRKRLNDKQCNFVSKGACHLKTCSMLKEMDEAKRGGIDIKEIDMPECKTNGRFEPKQCSSPFDCYCVGEDGTKISDTSSGKCNVIEETKKIETTLSFKGDFRKMQREGKLGKFKKNVLKMFTDKYGIPPEMIKMGEPYEGSIKVDVEIISQEDNPDTDLAVVSNILKQAIDSGGMTVDVDDEVLSVDSAASAITSSTYVDDKDPDNDNDDDDDEDDEDDDGLSKRDTIIIAACCGGAGMALLILIAYCCCCKERKKPDPVDDTFRHERTKPSENIYDNPDMTFKNKGFMPEEDHYMKVRM